MSSDIDAQVTEDMRKLLGAIQACAPEWPEGIQVKYLRLFMEMGLDDLEKAEGDYFDFMTTCIHLAGENMQDARLWALESQVAELQNPTVSLEELLLDAAILLVGELLVVSGFYYALPAVLVLLRNRSTATAARGVIDSAVTVAQSRLSALQVLRAERLSWERVAFELDELALSPGISGTAAAAQVLRSKGSALREIRRIRDAETHVVVAFNTSPDVAKKAIQANEQSARPNCDLAEVPAQATGRHRGRSGRRAVRR